MKTFGLLDWFTLINSALCSNGNVHGVCKAGCVRPNTFSPLAKANPDYQNILSVNPAGAITFCVYSISLPPTRTGVGG